jgi:hypothetical protein
MSFIAVIRSRSITARTTLSLRRVTVSVGHSRGFAQGLLLKCSKRLPPVHPLAAMAPAKALAYRVKVFNIGFALA